MRKNPYYYLHLFISRYFIHPITPPPRQAESNTTATNTFLGLRRYVGGSPSTPPSTLKVTTLGFNTHSNIRNITGTDPHSSRGDRKLKLNSFWELPWVPETEVNPFTLSCRLANVVSISVISIVFYVWPTIFLDSLTIDHFIQFLVAPQKFTPMEDHWEVPILPCQGVDW